MLLRISIDYKQRCDPFRRKTFLKNFMLMLASFMKYKLNDAG